MLKIDRKGKNFEQLKRTTLADAKLAECHDLQKMILKSPSAFFGEISEPLLLIGEEVRPVEFVDDRIDLLASMIMVRLWL